MKWGWLLAAAVLAFGAVKLPEGDGKQIVEKRCAGCHTLDVIAGKPSWDQEKWRAVVGQMADKMAAQGSTLAKLDADVASRYLARHFGSERGKGLVEDICSLCHEWQRVEEYGKTREQWVGTIKGMISEGAPVTDDEFNAIVDFLAANYGPE